MGEPGRGRADADDLDILLHEVLSIGVDVRDNARDLA